jgi:murein L,D-transpeptidase YcbB/YkuD
MQAKRGLSEQGMNAFGRGRLLGGMSAVALAFAASLAFADPQLPPGLTASDVGAAARILAPFAPELTSGSSGRVSFGGEDQGGGAHRPSQQGSSDDACDNGPRDPPPIGRSEERPSIGPAMPAPTRGRGCANAVGSVEKPQVLSLEAPLNFGDVGQTTPLLALFDTAAIRNGSSPSSLDRFASARDDGRGLAESSQGPGPAAPDTPPPVVYDPTVGPSLSPVQTALQAALSRFIARDDHRNPLGSGDWRAARGAIATFYAKRAYTPMWVSETGLTDVGRAALGQLKRASDDGLNLSAFALPHDLGSGLDPDTIAEAETIVASAVVAYAAQASGSRVPPSHVSGLIFATPSIADPGVALAETAAATDPARRLADFNPPQKGYRALRDELKRLENPGVAERRFRVLSADLDPDPLLDLQEEGASQRTKRALNAPIHKASVSATSAGANARQRAAILANMELWRWEPRDMGERRIEVNLADFSVAVLEGDRVIHQARVVVGKPETPTPIFSDVMRYVLINPSWQVPDSIIKKEMASKLGALSRRGYEVKTVGGRLTVRQLPGDDNALGRFAFMFPNDHAIYLHDTPSKDLFDEETRAFSHGCIRVEDPQSLAVLVLGGESTGWTDERIEAAIGGKERTVFLARPLPIHIEYFTDFVDEFGGLKERPDVYGLIRKVEVILALTSQD